MAHGGSISRELARRGHDVLLARARSSAPSAGAALSPAAGAQTASNPVARLLSEVSELSVVNPPPFFFFSSFVIT